MSQKFTNLKVGLDEDLEEKLQWLSPNFSNYHILKKSVDARRRGDVHFVYSLEVYGENEAVPENNFKLQPVNFSAPPVVIIGAGPAGLFAALRLVERGVKCILLEQGSETKKRMQKINRFWRYGELDERNNVCFGEGGAGLFSDGKLITRIKSPYIPYVLNRLVQFGAPEEIEYLSNPHVGSDRLRRVIPPMREFIQQHGCDLRFDSKVTALQIKDNTVTGVTLESGETLATEHVILACGHSADDTFKHLNELGVHMEGKSFAVGLRIEHPQTEINKIQYRDAYEHPKLGAANYKLTHHDHKKGVGVYSFCMCPGGYVLSSGTEKTSLVCNGMSNYRRNSPFANSAVVVSIDYEKTFGSKKLFAGLDFRNTLEKDAFNSVQKAGGTKQLPAQKLMDFFDGKLNDLSKTSSPSGAIPVRLDQMLPDDLTEHLQKGIESFTTKMSGFNSENAQLFGVESRTSCPIRITRDKDTLQSISHKGLYPTGEGAGYAGGITSAACDGIRVAEAILNS